VLLLLLSLTHACTTRFFVPQRFLSCCHLPASNFRQALVRLRLWCDVPADKAASGLEVELPLPGHVARVHCEVDAPGSAALAGWEFSDKTHMLRWRFKKVSGEVAAVGL
jgi:AP-4 complex subunit mu-1